MNSDSRLRGDTALGGGRAKLSADLKYEQIVCMVCSRGIQSSASEEVPTHLHKKEDA